MAREIRAPNVLTSVGREGDGQATLALGLVAWSPAGYLPPHGSGGLSASRCSDIRDRPPHDAAQLAASSIDRPSSALSRAASSTARVAIASSAVTGGGVPSRTALAKAS